MQIQFFGAAQEVTGSCFMVSTASQRFLVDCGMLQGGREAVHRVRLPFEFDASEIDFVILTHAHIDHSGLLPKLTKAGFTGPIYCTPATQDLISILLPDSAHIQQVDAERALRREKEEPGKYTGLTEPMYDMVDVQQSLEQVVTHQYDKLFSPHPHLQFRFRDAGHILGSAIVECWHQDEANRPPKKIVFSGDLGQNNRPILRDPTLIEESDYLVMEATYGDRNHKKENATDAELIRIFEQTLPRGNVIIPAFAVGRTQEIIYKLIQLHQQYSLKPFSIFVDSPLASKATAITFKHIELFDDEAKQVFGRKAIQESKINITFTDSVEQSMALNKISSGAVIISASGMADSGRIRHHLRHNLPRQQCAILITGFQAQGTLGRRLVDGAASVNMFGEKVPVRASIHTIGGLSAHADQSALLDWAQGFKSAPKEAFLVHSEPKPATAFKALLEHELDWDVTIPQRGQIVNL